MKLLKLHTPEADLRLATMHLRGHVLALQYIGNGLFEAVKRRRPLGTFGMMWVPDQNTFIVTATFCSADDSFSYKEGENCVLRRLFEGLKNPGHLPDQHCYRLTADQLEQLLRQPENFFKRLRFRAENYRGIDMKSFRRLALSHVTLLQDATIDIETWVIPVGEAVATQPGQHPATTRPSPTSDEQQPGQVRPQLPWNTDRVSDTEMLPASRIDQTVGAPSGA